MTKSNYNKNYALCTRYIHFIFFIPKFFSMDDSKWKKGNELSSSLLQIGKWQKITIFERERREHVLFINQLDHWVPLGTIIIALIDDCYVILPFRKAY
jgi:hypothetical protein